MHPCARLAAPEAAVSAQREPPRPATDPMAIGVHARAKVAASELFRPKQTHCCDCVVVCVFCLVM
ncbi:hypothetical protein M419DRAFT_118138 [Trichoderma reesei RUT C-30]|uniref:Uncharacterized protein n=1 Tax=Hypocrea jecorina (strain ATCC 56765 / BCRC 32924 / NRRL 11460 / Rut C-30) TaxID=1344414 RepID=A0A024SI79_HYPJR|nr:hypothetical protein M419DRAFT_118138 [Trichoderma reesei RUT C-30]